MDIFFALLITIFYMIGGQIEKGVRRYGVSFLSIIYSYLEDKKKTFREKTRYLKMLLLIGVLSLGYGESSWLRKLLGGIDWLTRLVYALLISLVYILISSGMWYVIPILVIAFQIRAGKILTIGKRFDILIEDIFRGLAIFICTFLTIH